MPKIVSAHTSTWRAAVEILLDSCTPNHQRVILVHPDSHRICVHLLTKLKRIQIRDFCMSYEVLELPIP